MVSLALDKFKDKATYFPDDSSDYSNKGNILSSWQSHKCRVMVFMEWSVFLFDIKLPISQGDSSEESNTGEP